ncbi:MAG: alpha/beta hydrolase, partial [Gammaproteobacteria bacterium]
VQAGERPKAPYTLDDMADDGVGLLDFLGIDQAHICGASMGGMIVQAMAIRYPQRVLTMTSIMSTTGNPALPPGEREAVEALFSPPAPTREASIDRSLHISSVIGSRGFEVDLEDRRRRAAAAYDRSFFPEGVSRQLAAIAAHGNRKPALADVNIPALVIHGRDDPLVPLAGGIDTHEALPDAELLVIGGMGHDLPRGAWPEIVDAISRTTARKVTA